MQRELPSTNRSQRSVVRRRDRCDATRSGTFSIPPTTDRPVPFPGRFSQFRILVARSKVPDTCCVCEARTCECRPDANRSSFAISTRYKVGHFADGKTSKTSRRFDLRVAEGRTPVAGARPLFTRHAAANIRHTAHQRHASKRWRISKHSGFAAAWLRTALTQIKRTTLPS